MSEFYYNNLAIKGITCAVPDNEVLIDSFIPKFGEENVKKFQNLTGVKKIHIASKEQTASDLGYAAAKELLIKKSINPGTIGALVFVTQTPDYKIPATSCVLHKRLGLSKECLVYDINLGCSGYVYGLQAVLSCLQNSDIKKALLIVGDTSSKTISPEDRSAIMLFGDAGAATLVEKTEEQNIIKAAFRTSGEGYRAIIIQGGAFRNTDVNCERTRYGDGNFRLDTELYMNGTDVFNFTVSEVPDLLNNYLTNDKEYDSVILHQANSFILKQISKKCKLPIEKIPISIDRYGNTSVTSIPLTLCDAYSTKSEYSIKTLLCGFGVGLSWGIVDVCIDVSDIFPIIKTNDYYKEGGIKYD